MGLPRSDTAFEAMVGTYVKEGKQMEGRAHCALLTVTHFQKAVVRRSLIHLTSLISSCSVRCWKGKKRLQAALLRLHIKTHASTQYRAADRYSKHTGERWKKQLLIGKEELSSWLCSARVCAVRKKPQETQTVSGSCAHEGQDSLPLHSTRLQAGFISLFPLVISSTAQGRLLFLR